MTFPIGSMGKNDNVVLDHMIYSFFVFLFLVVGIFVDAVVLLFFFERKYTIYKPIST